MTGIACRSMVTCVLAATSIPAVAQIHFGRAEAVDGDSINIGETRFRLFGIDAVEARQTCNRGGETWNCGQDAAAALRALTDGRSVYCMQRGSDPYGRVVATCTVNGIDLAEQMVRMGYAVALRDFSTAYVHAEEAAKSRGAGIWSSEFQVPTDYRASDPSSAAEDQALLAERRRQDRAAMAERNRSYQSQQPRSGVYYRNCREARAAGVTPLYRGQPGYGAHMDGDGDGVACEPYRPR